MEHSQHASDSSFAQSHLKPIRRLVWLLLAALTPLWVNPWGTQPFEPPKAALVRTLVWLLFGLVLAGDLLTGRSLWRRMRSSPLLPPVAILALVIVVTSITAIDWRLSLWGSYPRSQGAATLLSLLLLCLLAADQLRGLSQARRVVTAASLTGAPLVAIGLAQAAGWNPLGLITDARSPVFATLGRANFLGAYLAVLLPLTLALGITAPGRRCRQLWSVLLVSELAVIGLTLTRGAWLAAVVSLSLFSLLWWGSRLTARLQLSAWSILGILFLSGPAAVLWLGQSQGGSTAARMVIWRGTAELISQRPLLGYGADALGLLFPRVYAPELVYYQGREFFVDRAHNLLLDWAAAAGLPGLLAFLLVLVTFVYLAARALAQPQPPQKRALLAAILAALLGSTANNLVSFDVTPTATAAWLLMGVGAALAAPPASAGDKRAARHPLARWVMVPLICIAIGVAVWQVNVRPILADIAARSSQQHMLSGQWHSAADAAEQAAARWPVEPSHQLLLSQARYQQAVSDPASAPYHLSQAEAALLAADQLRPNDPFIALQLGQFYTSAARQFGGDTLSLAETAFQRAAALAPNHAVVYAAWGQARLEHGSPENAAPLLREAVRLDATSGDAYIHLGAAEMALGRLEISLADYLEAVRLLPESSQAYAGLAHCYWQLGQPVEARLALDRALQTDPQNTQAIALSQTMLDSP